MNDHPTPPDSDAIDALVADHLDRLAQRVDATRLIGRVCQQMSDPSSDARVHRRGVDKDRQETRRGWPAAAWIAGTVAAVLVAFAGGRWMTSATADAATVLREMQSTHSQPVDRCYQMHFAPDPEYWDGRNPFTGPSDTVLWTRGDRFWAEATLGKVTLVYGRDAQGELWVSPSRSTGIQLARSGGDLPEEIAMYCAINSMTVPALVENVLADFDLRADGPTDERASQAEVHRAIGSRNSVVWATLKPGRTHSLISSALLEIDATGTLVRLILWTVADSHPRGTASFTLSETAQGDDAQYQMHSHLAPDAEVRVHQLDEPDKTIQQD